MGIIDETQRPVNRDIFVDPSKVDGIRGISLDGDGSSERLSFDQWMPKYLSMGANRVICATQSNPESSRGTQVIELFA